MLNDRPPASVEIHVAAVEGPIAPMHYACAKVRLLVGNDEALRFHFHTVQVGPLVTLILRRDPPPDNYGSLERFAVPHEIELPYDVASLIFPPAFARSPWPPSRILDWAAVGEITKRGIDMPEEWTPPDPTAPRPAPRGEM